MKMDASTPFKWLDMLEQEFDKNYALVDILLDEAEFDDGYAFDGGSLTQIRQRLSFISGAFGQLVHKGLTIFQSNLKLEAKLLVAEQEVDQKDAQCRTLSDEIKSLKSQLIAVTSLNPTKSASLLVEHVDPDPKLVKLLDEDASRRMASNLRAQLATSHYKRLKQENSELKYQLLKYQSETEALKLTLRYLDKERAGRIQQIQLLSNSKMPTEERSRVWTQLETEIAMQRCKTVVQTCLLKRAKPSETETVQADIVEQNHDENNEPPVGEVREIHYNKPTDGNPLGISIVGGHDVALPVIISSVSAKSPLLEKVVIGDLIKSANGVDLSGATRQEAVEAIVSGNGESSGKYKMIVCYLGGPDADGKHDDKLLNPMTASTVNAANDAQDEEGDTTAPASELYETVWLENGELWPNLLSGVGVDPAASILPVQLIDEERTKLPKLSSTGIPTSTAELLNDTIINEQALRVSMSSATSVLLDGSLARTKSSGTVVTMRTGIQPREEDVVEDLAASFSPDPTEKEDDNSKDATLQIDTNAHALSPVDDVVFSAD